MSKICPNCLRKFLSVNPNKKFCSDHCRKMNFKHNGKELTGSYTSKTDIEFTGEPEQETMMLKARLAEAEADLKKLQKRALIEDQIVKVFTNKLEAFPPSKLPPINKIKSSREKGTMMALISCPHVGEYVDKEKMGGLNEYNIEIFLDRLYDYVRAVKSIKSHHQDYDFDKLVIGMLGDIVSGAIHQDLRDTNIGLPVDCVLGAGNAFSDAIADLSTDFKQVEVVAVVGNHGRLDVTKNYKEVINNLDYLTYKFIEQKLSTNKKISFEIPRSFWHLKKIYNFNFAFFHGDFIKSYSGTPFLGISRADMRFGQIMAANHEYIDYLCVSHFHQNATLPRVRGKIIVTGSMKGMDEFGLGSNLMSGEAEQQILGIHPKRGMTFQYGINLSNSPHHSPPKYRYLP